MLQVGAKAREAAFNLASGASSLSPMSRISCGSKVAPIAVEDYWNINSWLRRGSCHGLSLKGLG